MFRVPFSSTLTFAKRMTAPFVMAISLAAAGACAAQLASPAATAPPTAATAKAAITQKLNIGQIFARVVDAGYTDVREIEWDDGRYEIKALNTQGQRVKLYANAVTGVVEHEEVRR